MRRAKIVATLGPASNNVPMIVKLIEAGLNVARVNMSHGDHAGHAQTIKNIRAASLQVKKEVAILLDLQGPKIRVDKLPQNLSLKAGDKWVIGESELAAKYPQYKDRFIPTIYKNLVKDAHVGASILFDDGLIEAKAVNKVGDVLEIEVIVGGELKSNKGINLPNVNVSAPSFTDKDRKDLLFGLAQGVDFIALSFVRRKSDVEEVKYLLHELKANIPIVVKVEKPEAITNLEEILDIANVVMIARGDMGVEVGNHLVPSIQKKIVTQCNARGIPVITATQMLESMIENSRPTRAEASDVANAIWDGTDAVMLSAETASGKYPVESIQMMVKIIEEAELQPRERPFIRNMDLRSVTSAHMVAASLIAEKTFAEWIIAVTLSGNSCLKLGRFRPKTPVLGVTHTIRVARIMCLYWGITPYLFRQDQNEDINALEFEMLEHIKQNGLVANGDKVVITHGDGKYFSRENSNTIRTEIIKDAKAPGAFHGQTIDQVEFAKGIISLDTNICASCQSCISTCPHGIYAVSPEENRSTFINKARAAECTLDMECVNACPTGAIEIISKA